jgi:Tfp pilus assembly protein PilX
MAGKKKDYGTLSPLGKEEGIVMPVALIIMLLLTGLGLGALSNSSLDLLTMRSHKQGKEAFYAAEGGIVYGKKELHAILAATPVPTPAQLAAINAPSVPGFDFDAFSIVATGAPTTVTLTSGPYASLNSISTPYTITVQASGINTDSGTVRLAQTLQDQQIPLFQFGVYYNDDLEIFPGPTMNFNGRVHSNANIYLGAQAVVDSSISSAGAIFRCRKDDPSDCDSAEIRTPSDDLIDLSYDHTDPDWVSRAYSDWGGLVRDMAHGVRELNLPIETGDLMDLIRPGDTIDPAFSSESQSLKDSRFYWKADLRILDGIAYNSNGTQQTLPAGAVSTASFFDYRENKLVNVRQIDCNILGNTELDGGILYVSDTQDNPAVLKAVRLINCANVVPAVGLTVASDNPIYVKGNFNTSNKKGAAILGDTVTFLSNNWHDANAVNGSSSFSNRVATPTTVNAAIVTGDTTTTLGHYNGGLENLPRFLENWSGINFVLTGSIINLWESQQATGSWNYGSPVYQAPIRAWSYDTAFDNPENLPPGYPRVRTLAPAQWARQ